MAWYDRFIGRADVEDKLNPAQYVISRNEGMTIDSRETITNYRNAYEQLEIVNRAVNMIVDDVSDIPYQIGEQTVGINNIIKNIRRSKVDILVNKEPNPFQDINTFKRISQLLKFQLIFCFYKLRPTGDIHTIVRCSIALNYSKMAVCDQNVCLKWSFS